jgi:hypothetical protein
MTFDRLSNAIQQLGLDQRVNHAMQSSVVREISIDSTPEDPRRLTQFARLGFMYETRGVAALIAAGRDGNGIAQDARIAFRSALACWGAIAGASLSPDLSDVDFRGFDSAIDFERSLALRLAVAGLASENTAETRLRLQRFELTLSSDGNWLDRVASNVTVAFVCLVRKDNGWADISKSLEAVDALRAAQEEHEAAYFEQAPVKAEQTKAALSLVGFYHLAQMVTTVGQYLRTGNDGKTQVNARLDTHHRKAVETFDLCLEHSFHHLADLVWVGCTELVRNALWSHLEGTSEALQVFGKALISESALKPVLELWPSQQEALRKNLLDGYQRAILVEMPTSAGKTLLAKFAIAQTKALNPNGKVAYIVPTRALVNQVTLELRRDFGPLGYSVELAVPAYELDPTESLLLSGPIDILVTTPEKLDLLIRSNHSSVQELSLVVADEAHNLQDEGRGARLELLLGTIKRERRNCRFLLLSPFLPNGQELVTWLGDDRHLPPIQVHWKPSRRLVATVSATGRAAKRRLALEALPAADNADFDVGTLIPIGNRETVPTSLSISSLSRATAKALQKRGGVLILCRGKGTASTRANEIEFDLPEKAKLSPHARAVCEYLAAEAGFETGLAKCIKKGVAFHHAGMSQEARWLVERLISRGDVEIVCGTTTLAQGVNFPISSVIVETLNKGDATLTYSDFWNIAGRAGRALMDTVGIIAFPAENFERKVKYSEFLKGEARCISSQLAALIVAADEIGETFSLANIRQYPQLSSLLQFLAHAVRVADGANIADELELILRSSLVYHQSRGQTEKLSSFVKLCRAYVQQVSASKKGLLGLADTTGFATPSVFYLLAQVKDDRTLKDPVDWLPSSLFGKDTSALEKRLSLIADVPEMRLGDGKNGPLDLNRTASIIRDWVNGDSIGSLSRKYAHNQSGPDEAGQDDDDKKVAEFSQYLFSTLITNASWGIGALEGLCLAEKAETNDGAEAHVPSMIYFGVQSKEAVWLRMVGLPRIAAERAAKVWREEKSARPKSYNELRKWVSDISLDDWARILPRRSAISPSNMRLIWNELSGIS